MLFRRLCLAMWLALLLLWTAQGRSDIITETMRSEDGRLNALITLNEPHISLGELLDKLSKQTSVTLKTNPREPASGRMIFLCCEKKPMGDVMNALWSLLSYQPGVWKWERTGKPSAFCYEFEPTLAATNLSRTLKDVSSQAFIDHAKAMLTFAVMSPEERKRNVAKISAALLQKDDKLAQSMVEKSDFTWNGLRAFTQALTPRQQQDVLHGGRVPVTLDKLPDETRAALHQAWTSFNPRRQLSDGQLVPYPEPSTIFFETQSGFAASKDIVPIMFIDMGAAGSISILGSTLQMGLSAKIWDLWILPGDTKDNPLGERIAVAPQPPEAPLPTPPQNDDELRAAIKQGRTFSAATAPPVLQARMRQLSNSIPVMTLGLLPDPQYQSYDPGVPYGRSAQAFLQRVMVGRSKLMTKWRSDALLVSDPTWFLYEDDSVPYALTQQLQRAAKNGFAPFSVLAEIAAKVTADQWRDLCHCEPLQRMEAAYPLLQFCRQYPLMLTSGGMSVSDEVIQAMRHVPPLSQFPMLSDGKTRALRVLPVTRKSEKTIMYEMQVQYQNAQREWHPLVGFTQVKSQ